MLFDINIRAQVGDKNGTTQELDDLTLKALSMSSIRLILSIFFTSPEMLQREMPYSPQGRC